MKIRMIALLAVALTSVRVEAQETLPAAAPPAGQTAPAGPAAAPAALDARHWSYAIGLDIGKGLIANKLPMDLDSLIAGIRDGSTGKEPLYSEEVCAQALQQLSKQQSEAMQAEGEAMQVKNKEYLVANAKAQGVQVTPSGLQYKVIKKGEGATPTKADTVTVHYRGKLVDGTVFDESYGGEPVSFPLGRVIPGWTEGLQLMKVGDKFEFVIPSELGYGEQGAPGAIPPNATLIFEVELLGVKGK